jgi:hypothetical protein
MAEVEKEAIVNGEGNNEMVSVVEAQWYPWIFGVVVLNPDWSSI